MEDEDAGLARRAEGRAARGEAATATTGEAAIASIETGGRRDADVRGWCVPRSRKTAATCTSVFIFDRSRRDAETWPQELEPHLRTDNHRADPMSVATMRASRLGIDATAPSRRLRSRRAPLAARASSAPDAPSPSTPSKHRQALRFRDARTGVDVVLVGTMHYNPASIELASSTVASLGDADRLGAVVLETCPTRWAKTLKFQPKGSPMRVLLDNEFQAATEAAPRKTRVVLGDQRIEDLSVSAKAQFKSTIEDFASPFTGGWRRLWDDARLTYAREVVGVGDDELKLTFADLALDPRLLLAMPLSLFRYPLAWSIKSPKTVVPFLGFVYGLSILPSLVPAGGVDAETHRYVASGAENAISALFFLLDVLEVVFLSRLFLKALLEVRNDILAKSVRETCEAVRRERGETGVETETLTGTGTGTGTLRPKTVVAVLGAAHLNGVQARLLSGGDGAVLETWELRERDYAETTTAAPT